MAQCGWLVEPPVGCSPGAPVGCSSGAPVACSPAASSLLFASASRSVQYESTSSLSPAAATSALNAGLSSALPCGLLPTLASYALHRPTSDGDGEPLPSGAVAASPTELWVLAWSVSGLGSVPLDAANATPPAATTVAAPMAIFRVS